MDVSPESIQAEKAHIYVNKELQEPEENPADLLKLLTQSPELATILKALSKIV